MCSVLDAIDRDTLLAQFQCVRQASIEMCRPLKAEEYRLQPIEDVSPPWWNLGHTSWFFVRNVLRPYGGESEPDDDAYDCLLNSYYASIGPRLPRGRRGWISRPTNEEIYRYRESVDRRVEERIRNVDDDRFANLAFPLQVGIQHEQQHQELFYTEIKFILAQNPLALRQPYASAQDGTRQIEHATPARSEVIQFDGGLFEFGNLEGGWCWDNELPVHEYFLAPFAIERRLITNREFLQFIEDDGYCNQLLWLDNGWSRAQELGWNEPLYWQRSDGVWWLWTLGGMRLLPLDEPVCHVSFYEADAFARWTSHNFHERRGSRLPTEREWEYAARLSPVAVSGDAFFKSGLLQPLPAADGDSMLQMHGVLWQWTGSYYEPYPGYRPWPGVLAEYNGKFMDGQRVLRGGSCVTPCDHYRISYRNFWAAPTRFQFTGIRLARDLEQ